ncbi:MAG TPA: diacylglycerol kinase family protein [Gemmatimonadaceae bacterium]
MSRPEREPEGSAIPTFLNPEAGSASEVREALADPTRFDARTVEPGALPTLVRAAADAGAPRVAVAGGDGTIAAAAAVLAGTATELAVIPAGTLNHFARDHDIPLACDEAAAVATHGRARPVDVARVNDRIFLNTSSAGAYVTFVRARERLESRVGYALASLGAGVQALAASRSFRLELDVAGRARVYRTMLVFIGVGERELRVPVLGGRVDGGRRGLHVIVPRARTRRRLVLLAALAAVRGVRGAKRAMHLDSFVVDHCRIHFRRPRGTVALDGELAPLIAPLSYAVERDALRLVAP